MTEILSESEGSVVSRYRAHVDRFWRRVEMEIGLLPRPPSTVMRLAWSDRHSQEEGKRISKITEWFSNCQRQRTKNERLLPALAEMLRATVADTEVALKWLSKNKTLDAKTKKALTVMIKHTELQA